MKIVSFALVLALGACGGIDEGAVAPGGIAEPEPEPALTEQEVTVRLLGVRGTGPVLVRVASLQLTLDGRPVPALLTQGEFDLANDQSAWALATLDLPLDARELGIALRFEPDGFVERAGTMRALDLSGPALSVVASAAEMRKRSKVVIELDLARSIVEQDDEVFLLPELIVRY